MSSFQVYFVYLLAGISLVWSLPTQAQIIPDQTLGAESSTVSNNVDIKGEAAELIEGGAVRSPNLFHSFTGFNVNEAQRVYFANPIAVESILSRVTGNSGSNIFGTLGVDGSADLFLLNPNGIVFGPNVNLDIEGAFYATTAEAVAFGSELFSTVNPHQNQLLSISPSVLFWNHLTEQSGDITSRGQLAVGDNLVLAANNIDLEAQVAAGGHVSLLATDTVKIRDAADIPFIGFAGRDLLIQGNEQVDIVALSHPNSGLLSYGDMVLRSSNSVGGDAHFFSGGNFRIEQLDGTLGELFSPIDPIIRTYGNVEIDNYFGSSLHILAGGSVQLGSAVIFSPDAGELNVDFLQESIELSDGTLVDIDGGVQPTLDIRAGVRPEAVGMAPFENITGANFFDFEFFFELIDGEIFFNSPEFSDASGLSDIRIGDVVIAAPDGLVLLTNQYMPNPEILAGSIYVTNAGTFAAGIETSNFGQQDGIIRIDSRNDIVVTNSFLRASGLETTEAILLLANETVSFNQLDENSSTGSFSFPLLNESATGGTIRISAANLDVLNGALLQASTSGQGNAGDIILEIRETASFIGVDAVDNSPSGAFATINPDGQGQGGNVQLSATNLEVLDGANISASVFGEGTAGNVILDIQETARFAGSDPADGDPSGAFSSIEANGRGQGGNVQLSANNLEVLDGANISASVFGEGTAGSVILNIQDTARLVGIDAVDGGPSGAFSIIGTNGTGQSGNIQLSANNLEVIDGAVLSASTSGEGSAGNVIINVQETARLIGSSVPNGSPSGVFSRINLGGGGQGGDVQLSANNLELLDGAVLTASTFGLGDAGDILLNVEGTILIDGFNANANNASGLFSQVNGIGEGGDIQLSATNLRIVNGGGINSAANAFGNAGDIIIDVDNRIQAQDGSIATNSFFNSGGDIKIDAKTIFLFGDSDIQTFVDLFQGSGGSITISADALVALDDSDILAFAGDGSGGNITLDTRAFFGENYVPGSPPPFEANDRVDINATGGLSSGNILISDVTSIENSLSELPDTFVNADTLVSSSCIVENTNLASSLSITGRDNLPQQTGVIQTPYSLGTVQSTEQQIDTFTNEPMAIYELSDGRLVMSRECMADR